MLNKNCAVEGCIWIMPELDEKRQDTDSRNILLDIIHTTEHEETLMELSPHFLEIGRK